MKKYTTKPFELNQISQDTKIVTKEGNRAIKITYIPELDHGRPGDKCVSAVILKEGDGYHNSLKLFTKTGKYSTNEYGHVNDLFIAEEYEELNGYVLVVLNVVTRKKEFAKISSTKLHKSGEYLSNDFSKIVIGYIPVTLSTENIECD